MRIDKWVEYTPWCDNCQLKGRDFSVEEGYVIENNRKAALKMAKARGWKTRKGKTFCPTCQKVT